MGTCLSCSECGRCKNINSKIIKCPNCGRANLKDEKICKRCAVALEPNKVLK
ncbi:hypothetical protein SPTER_41550 [Sporomusa termitida]|uniref:Double zinc ribbon n=1 Tax=Sporomusa termitida TaxID=2377 RepID=A0A517DZD9_9FIRM|nr:hypothetical protein SPTER_41550 [Sporomusa termitida]